MRQHVTPKDVVDLLNEALEVDKEAMVKLFATRVPCNASLANHPTIQVRGYAGPPTVGFLGLINGFFGVDERGYGPIGAHTDKDGNYTRFVVLESEQK